MNESRDSVGKAPFMSQSYAPVFFEFVSVQLSHRSFYNPLLGAFLPRFTEMAGKQPCFPLNTKSIEQRLGLYKSSSLPAMGYCLSLHFIMVYLAFC